MKISHMVLNNRKASDSDGPARPEIWWDARPLLGRGTGSQRVDLRLRASFAQPDSLADELVRQMKSQPNRPIFAPLTPLWAEAWPKAALPEVKMPPLHLALPDVRGLIREATEHGIVGAGMRRVFRMGVLNFIWFGIQNIPEAPLVLQKKFPAYFRILVRLELAAARHLKPTTVLLHQPMTDLAVAMGNSALLEDFIRLAQKRGYRAGFLTANEQACRALLTDFSLLVVNVRGGQRGNVERTVAISEAPAADSKRAAGSSATSAASNPLLGVSPSLEPCRSISLACVEELRGVL